MVYSYNELGPSDTALLLELLQVFGEVFNEPETYQGKVPNEAYLQALLSKGCFLAVVAQDQEGKLVGGLAGYVLEKFEQERKEIFIYDLAVMESHRRRGVATGLIRKTKEIAVSRGACLIFVQADKGDTPAIRLYESFGRREEIYHFDIRVD